MKNILKSIKNKIPVKNSGKVSAAFGSNTDGSGFEGKNAVGKRSAVLNSRLGYASYVASGSFLRATKVGRYCCIGKNVRIVDVTHPSRDYVSIHPLFFAKNTVVGKSYVGRQKFEEHIRLKDDPDYSVRIGSDVWIGDGAMILGGHVIGDGAIVAAGSVVTKDVEPYTIVGGVPAKPIRKRFTEDQIDFLMNLKWWEKDEQWIRKNADLFDNINAFVNSTDR